MFVWQSFLTSSAHHHPPPALPRTPANYQVFFDRFWSPLIIWYGLDPIICTLSFNSPSELDDVWDSLKALISNRKPGEKEHLYAFLQAASSKSSTSPTDPSSSFPGWNSYDPHAEFTRMKVIGESSKNLENNAWRLTTINKDFNVRFIARLSSTRRKQIFLLVFCQPAVINPPMKITKQWRLTIFQFCST